MSDNLETSQPNDAAARTETGELKDQTTQTSTAKGAGSDKDQTQDSQDKTKSPGTSKPAETKADDGKSLLNKDAKAGEKPSGAPDKYEDFKVPEGFTLDAEVSKEAGTLFKDLNLSQDQGQKLVDFYIKQTKDAFDAPFNAWRDTQDKWVAEIKADPEIGGKLDQVKTTVSRAIDGLGDPKLAADFRQAMDYTGAGNNPAFIRAFYRLAQKVTEGGIVTGRGPSAAGQAAPGAAPASIASALYPNLK